MANARMQRLVLKPVGADEDDGNARQLVLDLNVDPETRLSTGPFPAFGRAGDFRRPETLYPFTLMMDGRLDLGAHASDAERQDMLAIRAARMETGAQVARTVGGREDMFVIVSVTPLSPD